MGIHGLWPLLEPSATSITLDLLEGKRLAVDISFWLHQAAQGYSNAGDGPDAKYSHLTLLLRRIAKLLFYKIRPVFVFDGPDVPVFKRQVLRDRALKRHLDDILTNERNQKRMLEQIARVNQNASDDSFEEVGKQVLDAIVSPKKKARRSADDDIFALPSTSCNNRLTTETSAKIELDYLEGYESLQTSDARVNFLKEAKEKCRSARLRSDEIPDDSKAFSDFQLKRLINRNRINTQLDMIKKDRLRQNVKVSENNTKMVVVDNQLRSHVLLHNEDVQVVNPEREARERALKESLCWPEFWRQQEASKFVSPLKQSSANDRKFSAEMFNEDSEDALQEVILASIAESNGLTDRAFRQLPEAGINMSADVFQDDWSSSEDEVDHVSSTNGASKRLLGDAERVDYMSDADSSSSSETPANPESLDENGDREDYFQPKNVPATPVDDEQDERSVYAECQKLLACLGVPYLCAPGEAEAQCVELERLGLVDGIVSDDSDVWLFGAKLVYKNMFSHSKHVQEYRLAKILDNLGLSRNEFIQIGMLSGGDYTKGFQQVGVVTALELISEFLSTDNANAEDPSALLEKIGNWLRTKPKRLTKENGRNVDRNDNSYVESKSKIRLRKLIEASNEKAFIEAFPNKEVFKAYASPNVNSSDQRFTWNRVDFESLTDFLWTKIGWKLEKLNQITHGAFQKWDTFVQQTSRQYQSRMDAFISRNAIVDTAAMAPTFRVQMALAKLKVEEIIGVKDRVENNEELEDEKEMDLLIIRDAAKTAPSSSKNGTAATKSKASSSRSNTKKPQRASASSAKNSKSKATKSTKRK